MITDDDRRKVYKILTAEGPDVDMWSAAFGRLVGRAKKAGALKTYPALRHWLKQNGMFGPKSDRLRADADKYY